MVDFLFQVPIVRPKLSLADRALVENVPASRQVLLKHCCAAEGTDNRSRFHIHTFSLPQSNGPDGFAGHIGGSKTAFADSGKFAISRKTCLRAT
ncbi:MAG: hypothetical protein HPY90_13560 [Syntrophothermus sp.]|uniref:hypothetical protein n=1 Tax=Syntrophothermus sp. TaxID=2736299 RepID=UPI00257E0C12|nr:hypothetical protein [Syntrophothermus sp.]NSW84272.1 hypothetical protein [Syntrophothermus sp.]